MSEPPSIQTWSTRKGPSPWGPTMSMPRIASACSRASLGVGGDLDPARLAAAADQDLGLDRAGVADPLGGGDGLLDGGRDLAARHGDAVLGEQLLALILEEVHGRRRRRGREPIQCRRRTRRGTPSGRLP